MSSCSVSQRWDSGNDAYEVSLTFNWSYSDGGNMEYQLYWYHGQTSIANEFIDGVDVGSGYNITKKYIVKPFVRLGLKYKGSSESSYNVNESIFIEKHPSADESYIKPQRPPIHDQYAVYKLAKYIYETSSCIANSVCLGLDLIHLNKYGKLIRPSVGFLYGSMYQDKDESYGMWYADVLNYVRDYGTALAIDVDGEAEDYIPNNTTYTQYSNNYLKQPKTAETIWGETKTYDGAVQVYNKNKDKPTLNENRKYAKLSYWYEKDRFTGIFETMIAIKDANKIATLNFAVNSTFDNASNNGGIVGRLLNSDRNRVNHGSTIIGWKKIGYEYYWIIQNSWGKRFGDNGLYYVPISWFGANPNLTGGIYKLYTFTYNDNGIGELQKINPPFLNSTQGIDGRGDNGLLYVKWENAVNNATYYLQYEDEAGTQNTVTCDGMWWRNIQTNKYGETFKLKVMYKLGVNESAWSNVNMATTLPKEPVITKGNVTTNSISIGTSVSTGKYTDVAVHMYMDGVYQSTGISTNGSVSFGNLVTNKRYSFKAVTRYSINGSTLLSFKESNEIIVDLKPNVQKFYWTTNFSNYIPSNEGSDNKFYAYPITSTEWNAYIDTLKKLREAKKVATTRPLNDVSRGIAMTTYVNQAIDALNDMLTTKISNVSSTTMVTSALFLSLQNELNKLIDTL